MNLPQEVINYIMEYLKNIPQHHTQHDDQFYD